MAKEYNRICEKLYKKRRIQEKSLAVTLSSYLLLCSNNYASLSNLLSLALIFLNPMNHSGRMIMNQLTIPRYLYAVATITMSPSLDTA